MDFIRRGFVSVTRKPAKTLILSVLIFVSGSIIAGAVSIWQAVNSTELNLRRMLTPVATIARDSEKILSYYDDPDFYWPDDISADTIQTLGALPYVKSFAYSAMATFENPSLKIYQYGEERASRIHMFYGVSNPNMIGLKEGRVNLVAGRVFNEQELEELTYVAVIPQSFAEINNLNVGSRVTFENNVYELVPFVDQDRGGTVVLLEGSNIEASQKYEFEIIGIFEPVRLSTEENDLRRLDNELEGMIFVPNRVLDEANMFRKHEIATMDPVRAKMEGLGYDTIFIMNDPQDLERFRNDVAALVTDSEYFVVLDSGDSFEEVAAPMKTLQDLAALVLYTAAGASIIILSLLVTLFIRDRRHETGIYLSLGEKKIAIAAQIVLEVMVISLVAVTFSLLTGIFLSGSLSERMLIDQIAARQEETDYIIAVDRVLLNFGYQKEIDSEEIADSYAVSPDLMTILLFYAISLGTVCLSTLIPIFYTTRLNPRKILM